MGKALGKGLSNLMKALDGKEEEENKPPAKEEPSRKDAKPKDESRPEKKGSKKREEPPREPPAPEPKPATIEAPPAAPPAPDEGRGSDLELSINDIEAAYKAREAELVRVIMMLDDMLENLPDEVIDDFKASEDFNTYKRVMKSLMDR